MIPAPAAANPATARIQYRDAFATGNRLRAAALASAMIRARTAAGGFAATVLTPAITDKAIERWDDLFKQLFR